MDIEEDSNYKKMRKNQKLRKKQKRESFEGESDQYQYSDDSSQQGHHDSYQYDDFVVKDDQSDSDYDVHQRKRDKVVLVREKDEYMTDIQRRNKNRLHKKRDQYRDTYQYNDEDEINEQNYLQEDNDDRDYDNYEQIFEPQDLIENYETSFDKLILETDIPERLQLRYQDEIPQEQELLMEANWLTNQIIKFNRIQETQTQNLIQNVFRILTFIKLEKYEVMFIWLHKRQYFTQRDSDAYELELKDLQLIYEQDQEWSEINQKKQKIDSIISLIQNDLNIPINQLQIYKNYIEINELQFLEEYLMYELKKKKRQHEIDELLNIKNTYKKRQIRQFSYEMYKLNIEPLIYSAFQQPKHFADNLLQRQLYHVTQNPKESLQQFAQQLTQPQTMLLEDSEKAMNNCFNYVAGEYFNNPIIKSYLQQLYNNSVILNTNPTENGKKLNMYNYYYVTKRIRNKKPNNLNLELWLLMRESQEKNLITIDFVITQDQENNIISDLLQYNNQNNIETDQWYLARKEVIRILINNYMIPYYEKKLIEELNKSAENFVQDLCTNEFKNLINTKPYRTQYFKILACTIDEQENSVFGMINETGDLMDHMTLYNIIKKPMDHQLSKKTLYEEDKAAFARFIQQYQPNVITISPKNIKAQQLKINLGNVFEEIFQEGEEKPFLLWSDMKVSSTFAKCKISQKLMPDLNTNLKELISSARFIQNPLAETLNLWSDDIKDNYLFHINYHPLQHFVNKEKMKNNFEKVICQVVNDQGVDINNCVAYKHMQSPLKFVCGFGPRKAAHLINQIKKKQTTIIYRREDLKKYLRDKVYENAIAFIKVNENLNPQKGNSMIDAHYWLDFTRIHPKFYPIAIKIAKEALEKQDEDENKIIFNLLQDSSIIDSLDLIDYGKHMSENQKCNMHYIINFILSEFNNPFKDNRKDFQTRPDEKKIFYSLIQESEHLLKEEMILTVKIVMIDDRGFKVQTSSGIFGIVPGNEISNDYNENDIVDQYQVGQFIKAKVLQIFFDKLYLKLTIKPEEFRDPKAYLKKNKIFEQYDLVDDNTFVIIREQDYPIQQENIQKRTVRTFVPRRIAHPYFKNIGLRKVLEQFIDKQNGVYIFRPSTSRGQDYINLTWKFYNNVIVHLPIKEGYKSSNESLSKDLLLENTNYHSLDEIIENFIKPCNHHVQQIERDPKFEGKEISQVKEGLVDKKKQNRKKTPYCFSFTQEKPSFLILSYVMDNLKVQHELIKVKPSGLKFHEVTFKNLEALKKFFKEKFKTKQYQSFLDQQPKIELGKQKTYIGVKEEVKQEKREYKREERYDDRYSSNRRDDDRYSRSRRDDDFRRDDRYQQRDHRDNRRVRRDTDYRNNDRDFRDREQKDYRGDDRDFDRRRKIEKNYEGRQRNRRDDYQDRRIRRKRSFDDDQPQSIMQSYQGSQQQNQNNFRDMGGYSPFNNPYQQQQPTPQRDPTEPRIKFEHAQFNIQIYQQIFQIIQNQFLFFFLLFKSKVLYKFFFSKSASIQLFSQPKNLNTSILPLTSPVIKIGSDYE